MVDKNSVYESLPGRWENWVNRVGKGRVGGGEVGRGKSSWENWRISSSLSYRAPDERAHKCPSSHAIESLKKGEDPPVFPTCTLLDWWRGFNMVQHPTHSLKSDGEKGASQEGQPVYMEKLAVCVFDPSSSSIQFRPATTGKASSLGQQLTRVQMFIATTRPKPNGNGRECRKAPVFSRWKSG